MRAVTYSTLGEARDVLTLTEMPTPTPAAGEVLVRLAVSGVNPSDVKSRRGRPGMTHPLTCRSGGADDQSADRLVERLFDIRCGLLFHGAANFTDEYHHVGLRVFIEHL